MRQTAVVYLAAVLATGWTGSPATAQSVDLRSREITESEFLEPLLGGSSPAVIARSEALATRRAELAVARLFDPPEIGATREDLRNGGTETEATVSWRPPRPDRRRLEVGSAAERLAAAKSSVELSLLDLRLALRQVYADWAVSASRVAILESEMAVVNDLARRSSERGRVGEASGLEVRRLRLAELESSARLSVARSELALALGEVGSWRPELTAAEHAPSPVLPELLPTPRAEVPTTPEIESLEAELRAADLEARLAHKVAQMPEVVLGWKRVEGEDPLGATHGGPVFGLSWPIPSSGKGRHDRLLAETRRDALAARLDLLRQRVGAKVSSTLSAYEELRQASTAADAALADAEPALAAARASFRLGEADLTTLLDTVRTATGARLAALDLRAQALARQRDLERVRGHSHGGDSHSHIEEGDHFHGDDSFN